MSWSEDTRCLYCEGRLPLYRKITHGQFCSSAHRKAYWQEHERLAVERLHQTHSSLRSYRSLEVPQEVSQETAPYPELESVTQVSVATYPELETDLELDPAPSFDVNLYPIPDMGEPPVAASELLAPAGARFPRAWAEVRRNWSRPTRSNTRYPPAAALLRRLGRPLRTEPACRKGRAVAEGIAAVAVSRSKPGAPLQRIEPPGSGDGAGACNLVELEVPLQSDVLLQLLDQQMPHPDQLLELGSFAAHRSAGALACPPPQQFDAAPETALPAATPADRCRLSTGFQHGNAASFPRLKPGAAGARNASDKALLPAQGTLVSRPRFLRLQSIRRR